jgi:hypothetical protein
MTSLTLCFYVAAGAVIGMLTAFAVHNRRVGWRKSRTTLAEALDDLYADLGLSVGPGVEQAHTHLVAARREEVPVDPADFSDQLLRLKIALGDGAAATPREDRVREREMVPVQPR